MIVIVSKSYYSSHLDHKILNIFLNKKKKKKNGKLDTIL